MLPKEEVELHPKYDLFKTSRKIYIKPAILAPGEALVIDRVTEELKLERMAAIPSNSTRFTIYGIIGLVRMLTCKHLAVVEEKSAVGPVGDAYHYYLYDTWRIDKVNLVPLKDQSQAQVDWVYQYWILELLNSRTFYFSYNVDLSHNLRSMATMDDKESIFHRTKKRFIWNHAILLPFLKLETASKFVLPVINGYVGTKVVHMGDLLVYISLISRRRRHRSGRSFYCRGIDQKGYVSNFVETEMLIELRRNKISFVMTRGSFPFFWSQWPDLSASPKPQILYNEASDLAFAKHVEYLHEDYGRVYMINMATKNEGAELLNEYLDNCMNDYPRKNLFAAWKMDVYNLRWSQREVHDIEVYAAVRDMMATVLTKTGYKQKQNSVFHICSVDGVDSTDVLQYTLAKAALPTVYQYADVSSLKDERPMKKMFSTLSKLWLENSDSLALYYVGTNALKTDFFRENRFNLRMTWSDKFVKIERWWVSNFYDGWYNDSVEIITKNRALTTVLSNKKSRKVFQILEIDARHFAVSIILPTTILFCFLQAVQFTHQNLWCSLMWFLLMCFFATVLFRNRSLFVNRPLTLKKPDPERTPLDWYFVEGK